VCERHRAGVKRDGEDLDAKLAKLASDHRRLVDQFSRIFNHIAQLMLGPVARASSTAIAFAPVAPGTARTGIGAGE